MKTLYINPELEAIEMKAPILTDPSDNTGIGENPGGGVTDPEIEE